MPPVDNGRITAVSYPVCGRLPSDSSHKCLSETHRVLPRSAQESKSCARFMGELVLLDQHLRVNCQFQSSRQGPNKAEKRRSRLCFHPLVGFSLQLIRTDPHLSASLRYEGWYVRPSRTYPGRWRPPIRSRHRTVNAKASLGSFSYRKEGGYQ
jgi:hypothetical protein